MIEVPEVPFSKTFFTKRTAHFNLYLTLQQKTSGKLIETCRVVTHTHTRLTALSPGLPGWSGTRKEKPIWISLKQETVGGSGISWAIYKSAPRSRQTTTQAPQHSVFLQAGCPSCHPTNSVKALKAIVEWSVKG